MSIFVLLFLVCAVFAIVGLVGLILLIVGLATKRKALWGSGLAVMLLSVIVGGGAGGWGVHRVFQKVAEFKQSFDSASVDDEGMRSWFLENADVELPDEVVLLNGTSFVDALHFSTYYMKIAVPEDFEAFLEEHFSTNIWFGVREQFNPSHLDKEQKAAIPFWNLPEIKQCRFFSKGHPKLPDMTYVAYDKKKGIAYVVGDQIWDH